MTPVIFIHWGEAGYLKWTVEQAKKHNEVILLKNPTHKIYKNSMEIDRWFVLSEYMKVKNLRRAVYVDSDVLLYKNVEKDFTECELAFSQYHCGHVMFVNNVQVLDDFCLYIQKNWDNLELIEKTRQRLPGNVFPDTMGDMVLLNNFLFNSSYYIENTAMPTGSPPSVYDHNINTEDGFELVNGMKHIQWLGNEPVGRHEELGLVWFNSLHCQGEAKTFIKRFVNV